MLWWNVLPAFGAEPPPPEWSALAEVNPGLTLVVAGEDARLSTEGWCPLTLPLEEGADPLPILTRLGGSTCAVVALRDGTGWKLVPSEACHAPAPVAVLDPSM